MAATQPPAPARLARVAGRWTAMPRGWVAPLVTGAVLVVLVQVLVETGAVTASSIPPPSEIARALAEQVTLGSFWTAIGQSLRAWAVGLAIATGVAVPLGALVGVSRFAFRSVQFLVDFLRPIPPVALLPLLVLLLGIGSGVETTLAAIGAFFPLFFATLYGIQDLDPTTGETARVYKLNRRQRFLYVVLPGAAPYIATGMRIAATIALLLIVGTEMVIGTPGLGRSIVDAQFANDLPAMYARVVAAGLLGVAITVALRAIERRLLRWHASEQDVRP